MWEKKGNLEARDIAICLLVLADQFLDHWVRRWPWKNGREGVGLHMPSPFCCFLAVGLESTPFVAELSGGGVRRARPDLHLESPRWDCPPSLLWVSPDHTTCYPSNHITECPSWTPITWYLPPNECLQPRKSRGTIWLEPTLHFYIPVKVTLSTLDLTAWSPCLLMKCHGN